MAVSFGPKLNLMISAVQGDVHYDELRAFLRAMDALIQLSVISASITSPPADPNNGDCYIVPPGASIPWGPSEENYIARWKSEGEGATWEYYAPKNGWLAWNEATNTYLRYNVADAWQPFGTAVP